MSTSSLEHLGKVAFDAMVARLPPDNTWLAGDPQAAKWENQTDELRSDWIAIAKAVMLEAAVT